MTTGFNVFYISNTWSAVREENVTKSPMSYVISVDVTLYSGSKTKRSFCVKKGFPISFGMKLSDKDKAYPTPLHAQSVQNMS